MGDVDTDSYVQIVSSVAAELQPKVAGVRAGQAGVLRVVDDALADVIAEPVKLTGSGV